VKPGDRASWRTANFRSCTDMEVKVKVRVDGESPATGHGSPAAYFSVSAMWYLANVVPISLS
jgi:hypothetical protein